ncbi:MAG: ferrous iron transporter B [Phycisphaerae bacterium]|nr:ferrous iron transporter B [Phycisphaerae bacterium]
MSEGVVTAGRLVAIIGNPNVGKTTLFNRLAGRSQKTSNFPGTTQEAHVARVSTSAGELTLVDLPGIYGLRLDTSESGIARGVLEGSIAPEGFRAAPADAVLLVLDATNLLRNLSLAGEALRAGTPTVVALTMLDDARRRGIEVNIEVLSRRLGCEVVAVDAKRGEIGNGLLGRLTMAATRGTKEAVGDDLHAWAEEVYAEAAAARSGRSDDDRITDRLDSAFTHPLLGVIVFATVMTGLFWAIFRLATYPMDWIDALFAAMGGWVADLLPEGALQEMLVDGVIAGVGATVIFLPQIVLLFFLLSLLEHSGYLARAAFVIDRLLRPFGLPGHSFVPLLSGHACALPGIMAARAVPDPRERLATVLVLPFMSCTARIPVYVLLTTLLFPGKPGLQALAFAGCYGLGIVAGLLSALIARRTILRGPARPMALELPSYRLPSLGYALKTAAARGWTFLRKAGTVILAMSIVLWWLGTYPQSGPSPAAEELRATAATVDGPRGEELTEEADRLDSAYRAERTALGRIGGVVQPVFEPIGADRKLTIGILASFAAREVFVSTMAVQILGGEDADLEAGGVREALATAERDDGSPIFTRATSWSMLVFFVLAMQCLPTLAVTAREAGGVKWALLQLGWMTGLAYALALIVYQSIRAAGIA